MSPSIAVVIPYFGAWPDWAPLFFETLRRNQTVDFLIFTDAPGEVTPAPNIRVAAISFDEYAAMARERLGVEFHPPDAYKLCDLRPLLGALHQDELSGYDFYGWCDVDLFFGDIRSFYTEELLSSHDVLSTHEHRISGHFALFRNSRRHRLMYRRIYAWREALRRPEFVGIDEHGITNAYLMTPVDRLNEKFGTGFANPMTRWLSRIRRGRLYLHEQFTTPFVPRPWLDGSLDSGQPDVWYHRGGHVTNSRDGDRRFLYIHFMNFKSSRWRHDGTRAPWEGMGQVCRARPADMESGVVIDASGIHPLEAGPG